MAIEIWPVVFRTQLVRTFRPGEPATEAPFRTLRRHGWASSGMHIVCRKNHRAAGRITVFSALNVDAARLAREGRSRAATSWATAAARIEQGGTFLRLKELVSERSTGEATAALQGDSPSTRQLLEVLRLIARETMATRKRLGIANANPQTVTVTGRISESRPDVVVLDGGQYRTYVPRTLAESANRAQVGDLLALVTERVDPAQFVLQALPAIATEAARESVFSRDASLHELTAADARLLARPPAPLRTLVPVTVGR